MSSLCSYAPFEAMPVVQQVQQVQQAPANQQGGGSSDYVNAFHAKSISLPELNRVTLENIDKSPMFNPLADNTVIPTVLTGITPVAAILSKK
tara:strand:+ start:571 stop:846 length:276 start_codon:yes stop_codon:yes gene_type:complete